ncbi:putative ABC transport system ATP-binding protein [Dyadobacter koreensis]|uniref:Putative ABC transport system ATP-binding protein n=1 Tax=Dyadobacter koreensis TaxID=408657 RepID=A0A1H6QUN0_9BACT|nr:ATP-binding cassette domain-containing protein [Dyadobacter koreensis]SEI43190.1 putative ABC transport system ATP-binding protein [Dyadobacter koreensis]
MLTTKSLSHHYGNEKLSFPDLNIRKGEQWLLLGESGSGKTTLLHILTGIKKPFSGEVFIQETELYKLSGQELDQFRGQNIGVVFQQAHLIKSLTVKENLFLAQTFAGFKNNEDRIIEVLTELDIIQKINSYPASLSQGQLQRASIARAVLNKPFLLFADEPTSSLDNKNAKTVVDLLLKLSESSGGTLVVSTHDDRVKEAFSKEYIL